VAGRAEEAAAGAARLRGPELRFFYFGDRREHADGQVYRIPYGAEGNTSPNQREDVIAVFSRPITDSRYMPVSRDLSGSRRTAMLTG
jgi:hypothetical protein